MMRRLAIALLLLIPLAGSFNAEELTERNYEKIRDHVLPSDEEEEWRKIGWRPTFWDGVVDAQEEDKPIMLYAMNGHPFACT